MDLNLLISSYGYIGVFLASLIGSASVILPVPYLILLYYVGASHILNPLIVSIVGGLGSTFGELTLYLAGLGGRKVISEKTLKNVEFFKKAIEKYGPIIIFIFAATPLPDDIIYPILGISRYNLIKTFIACLLGKTLLTGLVVYSGYYSYKFINLILGGEELYTSVIITILAIIVTIIVIKIDWSRIFNLEGK